MKKLLLIGGGLGLFLAAAAVAYAAYDVTGSTQRSFTLGRAQDLVVQVDADALTNFLPGDVATFNVHITNPNRVSVTVTGLTLVLDGAAGCALTVQAVDPPQVPFALAAGATESVAHIAAMGDADASCEGQRVTMTATATGTMP